MSAIEFASVWGGNVLGEGGRRGEVGRVMIWQALSRCRDNKQISRIGGQVISRCFADLKKGIVMDDTHRKIKNYARPQS